MERASYINASFEDLARWLISVTIFLLLIAPYLYKGQTHTPKLAENALVSEHRKIYTNDRNTEIIRVTIHTTSAHITLPDSIVKGLGEEIVSGIDFSESIEQMQANLMFDQGIAFDEEMDGFESVIVSSTNLARPLATVQTDLKDDHAAIRSDKNTESKKINLSKTEVTAPTASEHLNPYFDLAKFADGASKDKVSETLQEEQLENTHGKKTSLSHEKKVKRRFDHIIQTAANRYEVDPALVRAIIMAESSYNPKAVSKKGAKGLMQLMPKTAEYLGVEDSFDPEHNIDAGVRYFKQLLKQFNGDVKLALAAYNAGGSRVRKYKGVPPFKDTQYYVKKVFEYHQRFKK
jgi:soluble lytic murein transglycosylase-like protein